MDQIFPIVILQHSRDEFIESAVYRYETSDINYILGPEIVYSFLGSIYSENFCDDSDIKYLEGCIFRFKVGY